LPKGKAFGNSDAYLVRLVGVQIVHELEIRHAWRNGVSAWFDGVKFGNNTAGDENRPGFINGAVMEQFVYNWLETHSPVYNKACCPGCGVEPREQ